MGGIVFLDGDALPFNPDAPDQPQGRAGLSLVDLPPLTSAYRIITRTGWIGERLITSQCGTPCRGMRPGLADAWLRPMRQGAAEEAFPLMSRTGMLHLSRDQIRAITVPRAIVWGSEDPRGGGSLDEARRNLGHPPERIIPGAGHLSMLADPVGVAAAIAELGAGW